jgi:hypothetical protein
VEGLSRKQGCYLSRSAGSRFYRPILAFAISNSCAGTPNSDEQGKKKVFAMLRQLGPFSLSYTFSMADMKWPEFLRCFARLVDGEELTLKEAAKMPWKCKARLVRSELVISSRYHRYRMEALLTTMKKHSCISNKIVDYFWRDEFRQRGTPHTHMAMYVKNGPVLGVNSDREICDFADQYMTTSSERASVENLEAQHGTNILKRYCLRKSAVGNSLYYRFGFPKVLMLKTIIIRVLYHWT